MNHATKPSAQAPRKRYADYLASPTVRVSVGDSANPQTYQLHSAFLSANSRFFMKALENKSGELTSDEVHFRGAPDLFAYFVEHIYRDIEEESSSSLITMHHYTLWPRMVRLTKLYRMAHRLGADSFQARILLNLEKCLEDINNHTHRARPAILEIRLVLRHIDGIFTEGQLNDPMCDLLLWFIATRLTAVMMDSRTRNLIGAFPEIALRLLTYAGDCVKSKPDVSGRKRNADPIPATISPPSTMDNTLL